MSRRHDVQDATGRIEYYAAIGTLQAWGMGNPATSGPPVNGKPGFAPSCTYQDFLNGQLYVNVGSFTSSLWMKETVGQFLAGGQTTTFGRASGNLFTDVQAAAGISPSATGADKIVAAFTVPANFFNAAGVGLQVTVLGTAAANGNNKNLKVILGATNTNPATDGSVTVTGGTTLFTTGTLTTNNGGIILTGQIFKKGAAGSNTQESMTTAIIGGGTHSGVGAYTDQTFTEANALLLVVTAQATTTATDVVYNFCEVTAFN